MHAVQTFSLLALAGSTLAAPQGWGNWGSWGNWGGNQGGDDQSQPVATDVAVVTAYTTVTYGGHWSPPTPAATPVATSKETPVATSKPTPAASSSWAAWSSSAAPAPSATGSTSGGYMDIVNKWRSKMGMSPLTEADNLQSNAEKTAADGNGQMVHELNPGTMAQVLAPGSMDEFEKIFVGGWLCERPNLPGLDGICDTMSQGWEYNGETGHADILTSSSYSKIGCADVGGICACDLA